MRGCRHFFFDWRAHQVAPLGPRTVVVLHVFKTEQIFQDEPGVRAAFADAAIGDHFLGAVNTLLAVELLQCIRGLERAVFIGRLRPRNIRRARNVSGALRGFAHSRRRDNFAR